MRAKGLGANVVVVEVNPRKALEAVMDGYRVMPMADAARIGDLFITVSGDISVIRAEHFEMMQDQAIVANSGHFNVELDLPGLSSVAVGISEVKEDVMEYLLANGNRIYVLAEGRLVNLASAFGHPPEVMDMSFANQALCVRHIAEHGEGLENQVYHVPTEIDEEVAALKLSAMGIQIETLTAEQDEYLHSWTLGT
nr:S-inosyl-L-homocysteine hydrolase [Methanosarcinales archaeon ANME-2c ERB4]